MPVKSDPEMYMSKGVVHWVVQESPWPAGTGVIYDEVGPLAIHPLEQAMQSIAWLMKFTDLIVREQSLVLDTCLLSYVQTSTWYHGLTFPMALAFGRSLW